jgi:hypothetical protein
MHIDIWFFVAVFLGNLTGIAVFHYLKDKYDKKKKEKENVSQGY